MMAQATETSAGASSTPAALTSLSQTFTGPLPSNLEGRVRLVEVAQDGTLGAVIEEISFNSSRVQISSDRRVLTVFPVNAIQPGQSVMLQLPSKSPYGVPYAYPNHLASTPCIFKVPGLAPEAGAPVTTTTAATGGAGLTPWAILLGAVVIGVGVAAATGAFSGGGDGGTNNSSQ
jgi:hypothetical protein